MVQESSPTGQCLQLLQGSHHRLRHVDGCRAVQKGFRINAVLPGPVETPILADFEDTMGGDVLDGVKELLGRHAAPADIADTVLFLASDAARWINGHALIVDGGISGAVLTGVVPAPEI